MSTARGPTSRLWREAMLPTGDDAVRARLAASLASTRQTADAIAGSIASDLPEFTVHDGTHLDALWPLMDLIANDELALSPTEAWVLRVAVVLHDLGLASAAYPGGAAQLRASPGWPDALAAAVRSELGRNPTRAEIEGASNAARAAADATTLRARHAHRAGELVDATIDGAPLVADAQLRAALGELAGRIAASHWWLPRQLTDLGPVQGAPAGMPTSWTVRPLLLAVLLRCADAAHLDALRAPDRERQHRRLSPTSAAHWDFQARLAQPWRDGDRLRFTSSRAFGPELVSAWWLCVDHLRVLDAELAACHDLLLAAGHPPLAVRSVADVADLARLSESIRCEVKAPCDRDETAQTEASRYRLRTHARNLRRN